MPCPITIRGRIAEPRLVSPPVASSRPSPNAPRWGLFSSLQPTPSGWESPVNPDLGKDCPHNAATIGGQNDNEAANVVDGHPHNPWGSFVVWHANGAVAVGQCRGFVEAKPDATDDALWERAAAIAAEAFDVHLDSGDPVSDSGLLAAIDAAMVPMLYAYMCALREQIRYKRWWLDAVRPNTSPCRTTVEGDET
jgi:hypothetical protein